MALYNIDTSDVDEDMQMQPAIVVVKAYWCGHCIALKEPLADLSRALDKKGLNVVTLELEAFNALRESRHSLISTLHQKNVAASGVPYIGLYMPDQENKLIDYHGSDRSALSIAKFVLEQIRTRGNHANDANPAW
jgi:hypothetical protein